MQISDNIFSVQNTYQVQQSTYARSQNQSVSSGGADTVSISPQAKFLYEQSLAKEKEDAEVKAKLFETELAAAMMKEQDAAKEDVYSSAAQEFKDTLQSHRGNNSGSGASGASGGSGSGGGASSTEDAMEDLEDRIKQVSAELASATSAAVNDGSMEASSKVDQLQSELSQLQAQLSAMKEQSTSESA